MSALVDELLAIERGFWDAAGDGAFYERSMSDDGMCLLPVGIMDKRATIDAIAEAPPWDSYEFDDVAVHQLSSDVAVLTYRALGQRAGADDYVVVVSTTYRSAAVGWEMAIHQQTPLWT